MEAGRPSKTALVAAYWRAFHQLIDEPRVLEDPLAGKVLGMSARDLADQHDAILDRFGGRGGSNLGRRLFFATRTRFAEQVAEEAVADGVRQVVLLGAGLETFAYRNPHPELQVYEVDHPDTQSWKRRLLADGGVPIPDSTAFAPVDFETGSLADGLTAAGFRRNEAAVFAWLGVVFYLTPEAIRETMQYIAGQGRSVQLVLDYLVAPSSDRERAALRARADRVATAGEPFRSLFTPAQMGDLLRSVGFTDVEDHPAPELIEQYRGMPLPDSALPDPPLRILRAGRRETESSTPQRR